MPDAEKAQESDTRMMQNDKMLVNKIILTFEVYERTMMKYFFALHL